MKRLLGMPSRKKQGGTLKPTRDRHKKKTFSNANDLNSNFFHLSFIPIRETGQLVIVGNVGTCFDFFGHKMEVAWKPNFSTGGPSLSAVNFESDAVSQAGSQSVKAGQCRNEFN